MVKKCTVTIRGDSSLAQGKYVSTPRLDKEGHDAYEKRTWRDRLHTDSNGFVIIPPFAFKNCLSEIAKYLSLQIPGKGKQTYTKHFESGIMVSEPLTLNIKKEDVEPYTMHVPSDGIRGGKKRVEKHFPVIHQWGGDFNVTILDQTITKSVFEQHVIEAGKFIGLGSFRPRNNGYFGRFQVEKFKWVDICIIVTQPDRTRHK
jgi:hypothetical protein